MILDEKELYILVDRYNKLQDMKKRIDTELKDLRDRIINMIPLGDMDSMTINVGDYRVNISKYTQRRLDYKKVSNFLKEMGMYEEYTYEIDGVKLSVKKV